MYGIKVGNILSAILGISIGPILHGISGTSKSDKIYIDIGQHLKPSFKPYKIVVVFKKKKLESFWWLESLEEEGRR